MKICWDNLENIQISRRGDFYDRIKGKTYVYVEKCKECGNDFLKLKGSKGVFCSFGCIRVTKETRRKISESKKGTITSEETKKKISKQSIKLWQNKEHREKMSKMFSGNRNPYWDGGYASENIPKYDIYASQIEWCESVRRNKEDQNILEVKCAYCGKWFIPKRNSIRMRIQSLNGSAVGENRLYCSKECKFECPIYRKIKWPKDFKLSTSREVQPELRQMVLERDNWTCQKCGSTKSLHCHHLKGIHWEPLESADVDMCMTLCKSCHIKEHKKPGNTYHDMRCAA